MSNKKKSSTGPGSKAAARARAAEVVAAERRKARRRSLLWQAGIGLGALVIIGGAVVVVLQQRAERAENAVGPAAVTSDGGFLVGDPDAPVTVQVVEDFQCPACQAFEAAASEQLEGYAEGSEVNVEYRGVAFLDRMSSTDYSSRALNLSACTMEDGPDVWSELHRQLYLQQPSEGGAGLTDDELVSIAVAAGADEDRVAACQEADTWGAWVEATTDAATDDGVQGTPTLFVNGEQLDSGDPADLQAAVDEALAS